MSKIIMLIPTYNTTEFELNAITLGITHACEQNNIKTDVFIPIKQTKQTKNYLFENKYYDTIKIDYAESLIFSNQQNLLLEKIISNFNQRKKNKITIVQGMILDSIKQYIISLNYKIAQSLNSEIILIISYNNMYDLDVSYKNAEMEYLNNENKKNIIGVITNNINIKSNKKISKEKINTIKINFKNYRNNYFKNKDIIFKENKLRIIGNIKWNNNLINIRAIDIANVLNANIINQGIIKTKKIKSISFGIQNITNVIKLCTNSTLLIVPEDRLDILITACLITTNNIHIGAILIINKNNTKKNTKCIYKKIIKNELPVFSVKTNIWDTIENLRKINIIPIEENKKETKKIKCYIAKNIDKNWITSLSKNNKINKKISPQMFCYNLIELSNKANKCIILPEGNEKRIITAASICETKKIAHCILLGNPKEIKQIAESNNISMHKNVEIINPKNISNNYLNRLLELRAHKNITENIAKKQLQDNITLGTLMLEKNEVDGLVAGAIHTTADTIKPALQLIKTSEINSLVSSIFFMLLPDKVLIYGDCAINPNPTAQQLSDIAIQSAKSAKIFKIQPYVAMISYATMNSATGYDVEKVREATKLTKTKYPNLLIDGPLQYDAAISQEVALIKAPNSPVAGKATIFIFPDLNTGNTTYKAVQRSTNTISIGPMLQGLRKPVNDLSRGSSVNDIVYTVALTAIQSNIKY